MTENLLLLLFRFMQVTYRNIVPVVCLYLSQNYIYFGDKQSPIIEIYDKTNCTFISSYRLRDAGSVTDMAMFASDVQPSAQSK